MNRLLRQQSKKIVLVIAMGGLSVYLLVSRVKSQPASAVAATQSATEPNMPELRAATKAPRPRLTPEQAEAWQQASAADWPRDPFTEVERYSDRNREPSTESGDSEDEHRYVLNAVMKGAPPLAMIDGKIVAIGDRVAGGAVVEQIGSYTVRLRTNDGVRTLRIVD